MELKDQHIIKLTPTREGERTVGRIRRIQNADIVIDADGKIIKHRDDEIGRPATPEELRLAVPG